MWTGSTLLCTYIYSSHALTNIIFTARTLRLEKGQSICVPATAVVAPQVALIITTARTRYLEKFITYACDSPSPTCCITTSPYHSLREGSQNDPSPESRRSKHPHPLSPTLIG